MTAVFILAVAGTAYFFFTFPDLRVLKTRTPRDTTFMRLRDAQVAARGVTPKRNQVIVPLSAISPHLQHAVLMAEDSGFYSHAGVDWDAVRSALKIDLQRRRWVLGGSTITQQLVKNLYLSPSKNPLRKIREILLAYAMEKTVNKRRILELYLNVVEWGPEIYGAEAAARRHFGHSAATLSPYEAATLAGMLINPIRYSPDRHSPRLEKRRAIILARMLHGGYITEQEYLAATAPTGALTDFLKRLFKGDENPPLEEDESFSEPWATVTPVTEDSIPAPPDSDPAMP